MPTSQQTRTHAECPVYRVLSSADTVQLILDFAGAGQWLFLSTVDSVWLECYQRVPSETLAAAFPQAKHVTSHIRITLYSEVLASTSRVRLAHACGLNLRTPSNVLQRHVGLFASLQTLVAAYDELELLLTATIARGAAVAGKLSVLIWLREKGTSDCTSHNDHPAGFLLPTDITSYARPRAHAIVAAAGWLQAG
jgi:hypothetical protein